MTTMEEPLKKPEPAQPRPRHAIFFAHGQGTECLLPGLAPMKSSTELDWMKSPFNDLPGIHIVLTLAQTYFIAAGLLDI